MGLKERRRTQAGRTGCGLCGADSLKQVCRTLPPLAPARGLHAAGVRRALDTDGNLRLLREDVGRHNALDKVIGAMVRARVEPADSFLLITSRVSVEIAQKAIMAGVPALVGMSAPTLAAVELAEQAGMTLLAFARGRDFVCYTHPRHMDLGPSPISRIIPATD
jgi:FdhD protein